VLHPIESVWGLHLPDPYESQAGADEIERPWQEIIYGLSARHYLWDCGDEALLARHGVVAGRHLRVGCQRYPVVVVPPATTWRASTLALLDEFLQGGGEVLTVDPQAHLVGGRPAPQGDGHPFPAGTILPRVQDLWPQLESRAERQALVTADTSEEPLWVEVREAEEGLVLFVQSHDRSAGRTVDLAWRAPGPLVEWDMLSGQTHAVEAKLDDGRLRCRLELGPTGSALLTAGVEVPEARSRLRVQTSAPVDLPGPYPVALTEPNGLPLDYWTYRLGEDEAVGPLPTLEIDRRVRAQYGLDPRLGSEHQPWYLRVTGRADKAPRDTLALQCAVEVEQLPRRCALVLERPEDWQVRVNDSPVRAEDGYWLDEDFRLLPLTSQLQVGRNEITLTARYHPDMEIEDCYLVGEFSVAWPLGREGQPGQALVSAPLAELELGSWVGQGLDFYGGAVRYCLEVEGPQAPGERVELRLPEVAGAAVAVHAGGDTHFLPWPPYVVDLTSSLAPGGNQIAVEVIGGRQNILGPLHTPPSAFASPARFDPSSPEWRERYYLRDHGLLAAPQVRRGGPHARSEPT
jgi:hypothetical protein